MNENEPIVILKLEDTVKAVLMLEDAIDVLIVSAKMFIMQRDAFKETDKCDSAEGEAALKRVEDGIKVLKSKIVCGRFFLRDFKERINSTGIDIDAEVEKYKQTR